MTGPVPGEVVEAAVAVCGQAFYYKSQLRTVLVGAGVPAALYDRYASEGASKYAIARHVLTDLGEQGDSGRAVVRRVVTELANMSRPDPAATDQQAGAAALAGLKEVAVARRVLLDVDDAAVRARQAAQAVRVTGYAARREALAALGSRLAALATSTESAQARGFALERLLADLFAVSELAYRPSYRTQREQFDGAFEYKSFTYLVEARWRAAAPTAGDLATFKSKVDGKLDSTRGVFLSMVGFDQEVVDYFTGMARGTRNNLLLIDGADLALIVAGQVPLLDALDHKIAAASQEGRWWAPLVGRA